MRAPADGRRALSSTGIIAAFFEAMGPVTK
jgi:hypothetical protein